MHATQVQEGPINPAPPAGASQLPQNLGAGRKIKLPMGAQPDELAGANDLQV
jgi:hypothetical protein